MCARCLNQDIPYNPHGNPVDPNTGEMLFDIRPGGLKRTEVTAGQTSDGINDALRADYQDWASRQGTIDSGPIPNATGKEVHVGHDVGQAWILTPPGGKSGVRPQTARGNREQARLDKKMAERARANGGNARPKGAKRR